jgi:hypothetical protein
MNEEIQIGNKMFVISTSIEDNARRRKYFMNPDNSEYSLTKGEQELLTAIGVDNVMEDVLRPYLAKFFETLPRCKSDAAMYLSKQCEVPYYVLWSIKFANRQETTRRIEERTLRSQSDIRLANDIAVVGDLKERKPVSDYTKLFTLINKRIPASAVRPNAHMTVRPNALMTVRPSAPTTSVTSMAQNPSDYKRIFTLMKRMRME